MADISTFTNQQGTFNFKDSKSRQIAEWNYSHGVKNILQNTMVGGTSRGVMFYIKLDGSVIISGTPTTYIDTKYIVGTATAVNPSYSQCVPIPKGTWLLKGLPNSSYVSSSRARFILYYYNTSSSSRQTYSLYNPDGFEFTITGDDARYALCLYISDGDKCEYVYGDDCTFRPHLMPAWAVDQTYSDYTMSNAELTQAIGDINSVLEEVL